MKRVEHSRVTLEIFVVTELEDPVVVEDYDYIFKLGLAVRLAKSELDPP